MIVTTDAALLTGAVCAGAGGGVGAGSFVPVVCVEFADSPRDVDVFAGAWVAAMVLESGTSATAAGKVCGADATVPPDPLVGGWLPEPGRARVAIIWPSCPPLPGITCIAPACIMGLSIAQLWVKCT